MMATPAPPPTPLTAPDAPMSSGSRVFESLLARLATTADDRIRNISAATLTLGALMKAVKAARHDAAGSIPTWRIVQRLCYFANARDTSVRSDTFRVVRHLIVDRETASFVIRERIVLCVVRALDREPKLMWERVQALKVARALLDHAPDLAPLVIIRALLAIATFSLSGVTGGGAAPAPAQPQQRGGAQGEAGPVPMAMGRRPAPGMLVDGGGGVFGDDAAGQSSAAAAAASEHDPLRRVALDTLRAACLSPALLPRLAAAGVVSALNAAVVDLAVSTQVRGARAGCPPPHPTVRHQYPSPSSLHAGCRLGRTAPRDSLAGRVCPSYATLLRPPRDVRTSSSPLHRLCWRW